MRSLRSRLTVLSLLSVTVFVSVAASSQAGPLVSTATDCDEQVLEQPFLRWADPAHYVLSPGGTFEGGAAGWSLSGGAAVVAGNEPFYVHGPGEVSSLSLPDRSSATSRAMCIGIEHPTLRFFARRSGLLGALKVEVLFEDANGVARSLPIGYVLGSGSWQPTAPIALLVNFLTLDTGERTAIAFRFTPQGSADWRIDDVYVDPYRSR